jgi:hypothetical protein
MQSWADYVIGTHEAGSWKDNLDGNAPKQHPDAREPSRLGNVGKLAGSCSVNGAATIVQSRASPNRIVCGIV